MYRMKRQRIGLHTLSVQIVHQLLLSLCAASQELHGAIAMRTYALAAVHQRLNLRISQCLMQFRSPQGRRQRSYVAVEIILGFRHQLSQFLGISLCHVLDSPVHYLVVPFAQRPVQSLLSLVRCEGIGLVQVRQDADSVFLGTQVGKHPIEGLFHIERLHLYLVTVESHEVGLHTESTRLVQTTATRRGAQLAQIGDVHLAQCVQVQII